MHRSRSDGKLNANIYMIYQYILLSISGLIWGSFLGAIVWRIDDLKSLLTSRSQCDHCDAELQWYDLIPLISYGLLRGKCRKCRKSISILHPLIEIITAVVFCLVYWRWGISYEALLLALIFSTAIITLGYDAIHMQIIDQVIWVGIILTLILDWLVSRGQYMDAIKTYGYGALAGIGLPLLLVVPSKARWMGEGDILLGLLIGLLVGFPSILVALIVALLLGSIFGLLQIALKHRTIKDPVAFGPFMIIGGMVAYFAGSNIINWYMNLL